MHIQTLRYILLTICTSCGCMYDNRHLQERYHVSVWSRYCLNTRSLRVDTGTGITGKYDLHVILTRVNTCQYMIHMLLYDDMYITGLHGVCMLGGTFPRKPYMLRYYNDTTKKNTVIRYDIRTWGGCLL